MNDVSYRTTHQDIWWIFIPRGIVSRRKKERTKSDESLDYYLQNGCVFALLCNSNAYTLIRDTQSCSNLTRLGERRKSTGPCNQVQCSAYEILFHRRTKRSILPKDLLFAIVITIIIITSTTGIVLATFCPQYIDICTSSPCLQPHALLAKQFTSTYTS